VLLYTLKNPASEVHRRTNIRVKIYEGLENPTTSSKEVHMDLGSINWLAVVVCVVIAMISGFIWYHPKLFYSAWRAGIGISGEMSNPNPMIYVFTIIAAFVQVASVALLVNQMGSTTVTSGVMAGFMVWLGFVAPTNLVNNYLRGMASKFGRSKPAIIF
jgi:uncharacterized membrane protein YpjA